MAEVRVGILMGSASDRPAMEEAGKALDELGVGWELRVLSAHRTPEAVREYLRGAPGRGIRVLIAGAGMAAHLAGVSAAGTDLPVIGVPMGGPALGGLDALLSTVQMPPGIPVATMGIGGPGARNAGLFAARILALSDKRVARAYRRFAEGQTEKILAADRALQDERGRKKRASAKKNAARKG
ncbi:MAG: 5-(carboxyamino)imidazole ribonucleotide mutase [Candidatus Tectomicrobia bacterium]|uniref:N5-carboxyaminoimidazole ribonucleotide mutase n=1 Tax=Tectimicrobiota bacterium TaxID=2528274 RepID=A0A932HYB7_UNCTE|nr:5-(carboxyamino)imidazole ribonucleotide mutase [Candidatus Tectomicrobia bacterium]